MVAIKSYTDLSQSKILSKILSDETADMWYWHFPTAPTYNNYGYPMFHKGEDITNIPCWSLSALLDVLPVGTETHKQSDGSISYYHVEVYNNKKYFSTKRYENLVDACYEMILKLHELKML